MLPSSVGRPELVLFVVVESVAVLLQVKERDLVALPAAAPRAFRSLGGRSSIAFFPQYQPEKWPYYMSFKKDLQGPRSIFERFAKPPQPKR